MNRRCPRCGERTIPVTTLLVSDSSCRQCGERVGIRWPYRAVFFLLALAVTVPSTIAVFAQQGVYAALLWAPFPIVVVGYLKARFCPLAVKRVR